MAVVIRAATASDEARCLALIESLTGQAAAPAWRDVYRRLLGGERGAVHVAEEGGALLGVATVSYNLAIRYAGEYAQLEELIVDPAARGKNVGGLLVEAMLAAARARGCAEAGLYLIESTERNRPFYTKYGFVAVGTEMRQSLAPAR
ncbi:MAG: GNAT family N-acetyltransferase [Deltaproteobacteria bacterium]|nr:GNAT family N-acetyltransferase [Deltaproteobacteria bacterium]